MLRRDRQFWTQIYQVKDAALFSLALWVAYQLRSVFTLGITDGPELLPFKHFAWLFLIIVPGAPLVLDLQGFYKRPIGSPRSLTAWLLFKGSSWLTVGIITVMFLFGMKDINRLVVLLFGAIGFILTFLSEEIVRVWLRSSFGQWQLRKRVLLIGTAEDTIRVRKDLKQSEQTVEIVGELDINEASIDQLVQMLHDRSPNGVIMNAKHTLFGQIEKAIQVCEREGVEAWLLADFFQTQISRTSFDDFHGRPILVFRSAPELSWQGFLKQTMDVVGAFILLLVLGVPMLIVSLMIKLTSPGPALFRQQRCGLHGRPFTMWKFRTMVSNAEQRKHELAALNEMAGPVFKVTNDPRITPVGRFLRKYSIDELPQLVNVLRGEMSLVGPRPLPVDEVERFDDPSHRRRLSVKPGMTCLWQISGRNNVNDFRDWVRLDLEYIDNWSFWLDVKILCLTVPVVLVGTGAK